MSRRKFVPAPNLNPAYVGEKWIPEEWIEVTSLDLTDLDIYEAGVHHCPSGYLCRPLVRDHYLIHYILTGKGTYQVGNQTYSLSAGQGFLICPDVVTFYQADVEEPWNYAWIGFHGLKAEQYLKLAGLTLNHPIFSAENDPLIRKCFLEMQEAAKLKKSREVRLLGLLYLLLSQLIELNGTQFPEDSDARGRANPREAYIRKFVEVVGKNYSRKISIDQVAQAIGINRRYLSAIFKESVNLSPQEFLINYRINKACELMGNQSLSISEIARSVGYEDPLQFSKIFRKVTGQAPREYRKSIEQTTEKSQDKGHGDTEPRRE